MPVNKRKTVPSTNLVRSAIATGSYQPSFDPYDLFSDDDEYFLRNDLAVTTSRRSDHAVYLLSSTRLFLNSPSEVPTNWGQINPNLNDYHSDPMEISSTFWIVDITDLWP
jgi:hypothetical protein